MKKSFLIILVSIILIKPTIAQKASPETVRELLNKLQFGNIGTQMVQQILPSLKSMLPDAPDDFWDQFINRINEDELIELIIPIYQKYLTEKDILSIIEFYDSNSGKIFLKYQSLILEETISVSQQWGEDISSEIILIYEDKF